MAVEELAGGIYRVDAIPFSNQVSVLLIREDAGWTLVDTGIGSSAGRIRAALAELGAGAGDLKRIYLTHHHNDHTAGLPALLEWAPSAEVFAPEHEAAVIRGELPVDGSSNALMRRAGMASKPPLVARVKSLDEGASVGPFRIVATPGHTLGHTSLLSEAHGLLFTADAFGKAPFQLKVGVHAAFCRDPKLARRSAEKLLEEDYETVVFAHGPVIRGRAKATLAEVVRRCRY